MRLPEFLTELSPVRETLTALEQGENAMAEAVAEKNGQVCVTTATGGLTLWERDYGLPVREGAAVEDRRAAVRAAMAGGRTLTPAFLKELCVTLGGGDRGEVEEDFTHWSVTALAVGGPCSGGHSGPETGGGAAETRPPVGDGAARGGPDGPPLGGGHRRRDDGGLGVKKRGDGKESAPDMAMTGEVKIFAGRVGRLYAEK